MKGDRLMSTMGGSQSIRMGAYDEYLNRLGLLEKDKRLDGWCLPNNGR